MNRASAASEGEAPGRSPAAVRNERLERRRRSRALHLGAVTREQLVEAIDRRADWQGARGARYALSLADERSESPGESRSRFLFRREGLPIPELQVPVYDDAGRLIGFSDFGWLEYHHLGEFDGLNKYGGIADDPRTPQQVVIAEKNREDRMRSQQLGMSRWIWADLGPSRASDTARRIGAELTGLNHGPSERSERWQAPGRSTAAATKEPLERRAERVARPTWRRSACRRPRG